MTDHVEEIKIGERIKNIRQDKGMTLKDVAGRAGLSPSDVSQIEEQMVSPSLGTLIKLAGALEVSVGSFLAQEKEEPTAWYERTNAGW